MKPDGNLTLIAQLRDLQIVDADGLHCGIVDDVTLAGKPGGVLRIEGLLVGPGGYANRLPAWWQALVCLLAGNACVKVPWREVESITSVVKLRHKTAELGLGRGDARAHRWLPPIGALK